MLTPTIDPVNDVTLTPTTDPVNDVSLHQLLTLSIM